MITADSSSLILLAKASVLETITDVDDLIISKCVYNETVVEGKKKSITDSLIIEKLMIDDKIKVGEAPIDERTKLKESFGITCGENETVVIAIKEQCRFVITDDKKCMVVCKMLSIPFMIALDVVIDLCVNKKISHNKAIHAFKKIRDCGWLSKEIIDSRWDKLKEVVK